MDPLYSLVMEPEVAPRVPLHPSLCMDCSGVLAIRVVGSHRKPPVESGSNHPWNILELDHTGPHWKANQNHQTISNNTKQYQTISNTLSRCLLSVFIIAVSCCFLLVFWCSLAWSQGSYIFCASTPAPMGPLDLQFDRGGTAWFWSQRVHLWRRCTFPELLLYLGPTFPWTFAWVERVHCVHLLSYFLG